jgi:uncharacterized membrane-anchored protein YhcB (DUF1043 family)
MENAIVNKLLEFGLLGIICVVMGIVIYKFWQQDRKEKQRLIDRLEKLNDELRKEK